MTSQKIVFGQPRGGAYNYIKQSFVSLKSASVSNPDTQVWLVTNQKLPVEYQKLFDKNHICIVIVPFDDYLVPTNWRWEYAFYKLKVLDFMVNNSGADFILGLDTDTYVAGALAGLWEECMCHKPILLPIGVDSYGEIRKRMGMDYAMLYGKENREYIVQYGGEFLGGSCIALEELSRRIKQIYEKIKKTGFVIDKDSGDEALLSMAAYEIACQPAIPYVRRYWTRRKYYRVDSFWPEVSVWHLPPEKNYGLNVMFEWLRLDRKISVEKAARLFNLPIQNKYNLSMLRYYIYNILNRC